MNLTDGFYDGMIVSCKPIKSRFNQPGVMELHFICGVYDENHQPAMKCEIFLEISNRYGMGNDKDKTWWQITQDKLIKLGWVGPMDLTKCDQLANKTCRLSYATKDKDDKPLKNGPRWSFTFRAPVEELDGASANAMLQQMMTGGLPPAPAPAGAPAQGAFAFNAGAPALVAAPGNAFAAPAPAPAAAPAAAPNPFAGM